MPAEGVLLELALLFAAAKAAGVLAARLGQPPVIGELLAGIAIGPYALGWVELSDSLHDFQELGAVILLFAVGLDTPLSDLTRVGGRASAVGGAGILIPFAAGAGMMLALGHDLSVAAFIGTALVATSVGVTARVLADLGKVRTPEGRIILGAAVVDDILGLLVLAVVSGAATGGLSVGAVVALAVLALGFVGLVGGAGPRLVARATPLLDRLHERGVFTVAIALCLGLAAVAGSLQLAAIIGAFLAGMAFAETRDRYHLEEQLAPVYALLVPFFFAITGAAVDLSVFGVGSTAWLAVGLTVVAIAGKLIGCTLPVLSLGRRSAAIVGVGMVPRGEVGVLVASLGLAGGIIGPDLYAVVVAMSIATTVIVPPILSSLFMARPEHAPGPRGSGIEGIE